MTCSSSGLPWKRTSGLGSSPLRAASLVPIPAARIRAVLVLDITSLHDLVTLRWFVRWPVIEIADGNVSGAEDHRFRDAGGIRGKPEGAVLVVLLDDPRFGASCRSRTLRFGFQHLAQHAFVSALPSFFGDYLEVLCAIGIARDRHGQDGAFVELLVLKYVFATAAVPSCQTFANRVPRVHALDNLLGA